MTENHVFVTYRHLRNDVALSNQGGVTLAIVVDLRNPENRTIKFDYALCNPEMDTFDKRIGREIAYQRLAFARKIGGAYEIPYTDKEGGTIVQQILDYVQDHPEDFEQLTTYLNRYIY